MNRRGLRSCLSIVLVALLVTIQVQLFATFYFSTDASEDNDDDIGGCYRSRNIQVTFTRNLTSQDVLSEWRSRSADFGRLLALPRNRKNYMSIGCVLTGGSTSSSTLDVLDQLSNRTSLYHKLQTVIIIVILADVDSEIADTFVETIATNYLYEISIGFFHILQQQPARPASSERTSNKQIEALSLLADYAADISMHYLHLGSSDSGVFVPDDYMENVRDLIQREAKRRRRLTTWTLMQFSSEANDILGYLLHSYDVRRFATFLRTYAPYHLSAANSTVILRQIFVEVVTQRLALVHRPPLFRRDHDDPAVVDSDHGAKPWPAADDPAATVLSSMRPVGPHTVELAYASDAGFFRATSVVPGDWVAVVFDVEVSIRRLVVCTGLADGSLTLKSGFVELSPRLLRLDAAAPSVVCADFVRVADIAGKSTQLDGLSQSVWGRTTQCLRLTVSEVDGDDVVFQQIAVFT